MRGSGRVTIDPRDTAVKKRPQTGGIDLPLHTRRMQATTRLCFPSVCGFFSSTALSHGYNAPLAIRYPPDIRPRPLPGLIFSNIKPRSVTNWISTCGLNRFATCSLRSAECHQVKPTANLVCVISEVTGAQLVTAAQHTLRRVGSL